jgi:HK97 family phage major capsid protein
MNIVQLESDLRQKTAMLAALVETTAHACTPDQEHPETGRLMTAEERAAIKAASDECAGIKARLEAAQGDARMLDEIAKLTGPRTVASGLALPARDRRTIGEQFTSNAEYLNFIKAGGHRRNGAWASPPVECQNPFVYRGTTLTEDPASAGKLLVPQYLPGIQPLLFKRLVVADLMAAGRTDSNSIIYMVETTFTNAAAAVAEGAAKPESALVFDQKTDQVSKIAHWIPVTEELLEDVPAIQSYIDARLTLGVSLAEEDQLLNGNGTPPNILGVMNRPGLAAAVARNSAGTPPETNADAILRQITAIATTAYVYPDGIVINPTNWFTIATSKDSQGQYFGGGPFSTLPSASLWGTPVSPTPSIVANTALVGAFGTMSQIFRKGGIRVEASNSHQDYFVKNLVAIRAEERLALAVYRPGSFGKVTGLN